MCPMTGSKKNPRKEKVCEREREKVDMEKEGQNKKINGDRGGGGRENEAKGKGKILKNIKTEIEGKELHLNNRGDGDMTSSEQKSDAGVMGFLHIGDCRIFSTFKFYCQFSPCSRPKEKVKDYFSV